MKWLLFAVAISAACADSNIYPLPAAEGSAEIEWISPSTFRFARSFSRTPAAASPLQEAKIGILRADTGDFLRFQSLHLIVDVSKADLKLRVKQRKSGETLFEDSAPVRRTATGVMAEHASQKQEDYWGLGPRNSSSYSAKGLELDTDTPFLISTRGYALYQHGKGNWRFDLRDHVRVEARGVDRMEYFFYYGPAPKEMFEEHMKVTGQLAYHEDDVKPLEATAVPQYARKLTAKGCDLVAQLAHASMSGLLAPAASEGDYAPLLYGSKGGAWRTALGPYLVTYLQEARDRGYPVIRPLPFQFPADLEGAKRTDEFMLGDELLVAPICNGATRRTVYLPRGIWTDFRTGAIYPGRKTIEIEAPAGVLPVFSKNGSLLPLAQDGLMRMHYFPKLGGEFFIWEPDMETISQLHTSPAMDFYRIEIESVKTRTYEWVIHEMTRPDDVYEVDAAKYRQVKAKSDVRAGTWFFDAAAKAITVRIDAIAGKDHIVNLTWKESVSGQ